MKNTLTLFAALLITSVTVRAQWTNIAPDGSDFGKIRFTSNNIAYVTKGSISGTNMGLAKTTDAGATWTNIAFNPVLRIHDFSFIDDNTGFVCADTIGSPFPYYLSVYKTTDGGANWNLLQTVPGVPYSSHIHFRDALHGILTETYSRIWITSDGGVTWNSQDFDYAYFQDITFSSTNVGYITCADGTFSYFGVVLKTTDGGATWSEVFDFSDVPMTYTTAGAVDFIDDNTGYMETMENFYKTTDGGVTWDSLPYSHNNNMYFQDIYFQTELVGYGCDSQGGIYVTTDGGNTWTVDRVPDTTTFLYSIDVRGTNAYVAGTGKILKKTGINGIFENAKEEGISFYPNPSAGYVQVARKDARPVNINVYNVMGEVCLRMDDLKGNVIDLSSLENGTYLVEYRVDNGLPQVQKVSLVK